MSSIRLKDNTIYEFTPGRMEFMGILNVTPDSFFEGSRVSGVEDAVQRADRLVAEGATFLDVGGESTRPGAAAVTPAEEAERVCPVIAAIKEAHPDVLVSVDTYHAATAGLAVEAGADIINDISAMTFDPEMGNVVRDCHVPVILMHVNGTPDHMQDNPVYENVVEEVHAFLEERIAFALKNGIARDRLMVDLGIGFGKTLEHNIELLKNIDRFRDLGLPHVMAVSRKTFIGQTLGETDPAERLFGTVGVSVYGAAHGLEIARVHDVRENLQAVRMWEALQ